ncbi:hypothetical protein BS17DRAFT_419874 [Gyrodon lividus]|nr:hypothetical protein BS17DRAFT_419874 [Gyrodon lividus]
MSWNLSLCFRHLYLYPVRLGGPRFLSTPVACFSVNTVSFGTRWLLSYPSACPSTRPIDLTPRNVVTISRHNESIRWIVSLPGERIVTCVSNNTICTWCITSSNVSPFRKAERSSLLRSGFTRCHIAYHC